MRIFDCGIYRDMTPEEEAVWKNTPKPGSSKELSQPEETVKIVFETENVKKEEATNMKKCIDKAGITEKDWKEDIK